MINFCIYLKNTGEIVRCGVCDISDIDLQIRSIDENLLQIAADPINDYVLNNEIKHKPPKPNGQYKFDYLKKQWIEDVDSQRQTITSRRNSLLAQSDWTQIPNNPLTSEKQQQWAIYRQELRDITSQSGYPFNVVWPTQPE